MANKDVTIKRWNISTWDVVYPKTTIANVTNLSTTLADMQGDIDDKAPLSHTHSGANITDSNTVYFANGDTSGTDGVWTATVPGITSYYEGLYILFKIGRNGSSTTTLNINGIGPITCYRYSNSKLTTHFGINAIIPFVYTTLNGGSWMVASDTYDSTDPYTDRYNQTFVAGETIYRYKLVMEAPDGKLYPLTITDDVNGNLTNKVPTTAELAVFGHILMYMASSTITAGTAGGRYYMASQGLFSFLHYTSNKLSGWLAYYPIYVVGTVVNDRFILDGAGVAGSTAFITQTLPTTEDGKVYVKIGYMNNTTNEISMHETQQWLVYQNGKVVPYVHVYPWAKASTKPTYTAGEVNARPSTWVPTWSDISGKPSTFAPIIGTGATEAAAGNHTHAYSASNHVHGSITNDGRIGSIADLVVVTGTNGVLTTQSRAGIDTRTSFPASSHSHSEYVPTTRTINGSSLTSNITINADNIYSPIYDDQVDSVLETLDLNKVENSTILRSKINASNTSVGTSYTSTGLSLNLEANTTYKLSMTGHWERVLPGTTAWAYRQSIVSNTTGVFMRGMWTYYQTDAYSGASTTIAYSASMSASSGTTGQTVTTPSATTAVSYAPMCFEGYVVTGANACTISFTHSTSATVYSPSMSSFRGVFTAVKM